MKMNEKEIDRFSAYVESCVVTEDGRRLELVVRASRSSDYIVIGEHCGSNINSLFLVPVSFSYEWTMEQFRKEFNVNEENWDD